MDTIRKKTILGLALAAALATFLAFAGSALADRGGNAVNAKLCHQGGWSTLMDSSAKAFANEDDCVSDAAQGGAIYALAALKVSPCANQPFDGICVSTSGFGLQPGSVVTTTMLKNGAAVREDYPIVLGDGTVSDGPVSHFELPCVAGNQYAASATGTSAASLSVPAMPGIPVASNTVERSSSCP